MSGIIVLATAFAMIEATTCLRFNSVIVEDKSTNRCPSAAEEARANASQQIQSILESLTEIPECGEGKWLQVSNLNMSDPQQDCPPSWSLVSSPARSCVGPVSVPCESAVLHHSFGLSYKRVCGQARGYVTATPDAFVRRNVGINGPYLDGVSITRGHPRQHIWSLAAGFGQPAEPVYRCPCDTTNTNDAPLPPSFVGNNYFCDGKYNGALWDGKGCTTACCTFNNPPWFTVTLPAATNEEIEVRICHDEDVENERIYLNTLLLYVQ